MTEVSSTTLKTTTLPFDIVCPPWCIDDPRTHVSDLWNMGGNCFHGSPTREALDRVGLHGGDWDRPNFCDGFEVHLTTSTEPGGRESAPPVIYINDRECSISQALELADILAETVALYRSAGGKA